MKICWWTVYPTVNQSAMLTALRARGVDVEACYFGKYDAYRGLLAWRERPLEPWEHHASTIAAARAAVPDWAERIQMVSSFADGISWRVMLWCWWHGRPWFAMTEGSRARWFVRPVLRLFAWFVNRDARMGFFFGRTASEQFGAYGVHAEKRTVCTYVLPDLPAELPSRDEAFTFVYAGVLLALKAVDVIAEAFRRVHAAYPNVRLLVVGDGELKSVFDGIDGVELVGSVPPGDVCRYLARGHVVLQPSRRDGWGLALLEGAACGLAMIGSDMTRSAVDRIVDGVNGFCVPAGDVTALAEAMRRYAADPNLATRHGAEAKKVTLDMSGAVQADLFIDTLRRRCGSRLAGGPVKILHVMPGAEDPANGIAVAVRRLAEEQRARGAEVSVAEACSLDDCRAADVVFVHSMWLPSVMRACRTALRAGTPLVRMPHGCLNPAALRHSAWKKALVSPLERRYMRRAACVLVTTETEKAAVERWVRGVRRVEVVGMGVDDLLSPDLPSKRTDDGPKTFLFVGRLHPLKGLDLLLAALPAGALLRVIAPDGGRQAHYERLARQLGVADRVTFLGVKTGEEKLAEMRRADALVLPTHSENFGFAVAEALVVGTPAITTKGAPWKGLETHGCGWWTDVDAAALRAALADCAARTREELAEMGARGRAWMLGDLTWRSCAARVQDAIGGITNHEPRTANLWYNRPMKNFCLTISLAALACLCGCKETEPNVLTSEEEVRGWYLLWDGDEPTNGWVGVSAGCSNFTARGWSVTNHALVASAGADPIRTAASYKDFDLKVDYRMAQGCSGRILYFHNAETNVDTSVAYALKPPPPEAKGPRMWQTVRIVARRKPITHWLDGRIVDRKKRENVDVEGRIVLEPGEGQVEFRNVKIRPFGKW